MQKKNQTFFSKLLLFAMAFSLIISNLTTLRAQNDGEEIVNETENTLQITGPESVTVEDLFEVEVTNDGSESLDIMIPEGLEYQGVNIDDSNYNNETKNLTLNKFDEATISLVALEEGDYDFLVESSNVNNGPALYKVIVEKRLERETKVSNNDISTRLTYNPRYRTYYDTVGGFDTEVLNVSLTLEINTPNIVGSYIKIPLDGYRVDLSKDEFKDFDMTGDIFTLLDFNELPEDSIIKDVEYDQNENSIIIRLEETQPGIENINFGFNINNEFKNKIPGNQIIWKNPKALIFDQEENLIGENIGENILSTNIRENEVRSKYNVPNNKDYFGGDISADGGFYVYNHKHVKTDFDNFDNRIFIEFPDNFELEDKHKIFDKENPVRHEEDSSVEENYVRYYASYNDEEEFFEKRSNDNPTIVYKDTRVSLIEKSPVGDIGTTFNYKSGMISKKINGPSKTIVSNNQYVYKEKEEWSLSGNGTHTTRNGNILVIDNSKHDQLSNETGVFGWFKYEDRSTLRNTGSKPIENVKYEIYQDANQDFTDGKIQFDFFKVYGYKSDEVDQAPSYEAEIEVVNADTKERRTIPLDKGQGITTYRLPKLENNEYVDNFIVTPVALDGTQRGELLPGNGITIGYFVKGWENGFFPDGSPVAKDVVYKVRIKAEMSFDDKEGEPSGKKMRDKIATLSYGNATDIDVQVSSANSQGKSPLDIMDYKIIVTNTGSALTDYVNPEVTVAIPNELIFVEPHLKKDFVDLKNNETYSESVEVKKIDEDEKFSYYRFYAKNKGYINNAQPTFEIPFQLQVKDSVMAGTYEFGGATASSSNTHFVQVYKDLNNLSLEDAKKFGYLNDSLKYTYFDSKSITQVVVKNNTSITAYTEGRKSSSDDYMSVNELAVEQNTTPEIKTSILNSGNTSFNNIRIYNVLPYVGDQHDSSGNIEFMDINTKVEGDIWYTKSDVSNLPSYGENLQSWDETKIKSLGFSKDRPNESEMKDVTAVFIDFGSMVIEPGETFETEMMFKVPEGDNQTATVQFQYSYEEIGTGASVNPSSRPMTFSTESLTVLYNENLPEILPSGVVQADNMPENQSMMLDVDKVGTIKISNLEPTLAGYIFKGWIRSDNGETIKPGSDYNYTPTNDNPQTLDLKADWEPIDVKIEVLMNDSETSSTAVYSGKHKFGEKVLLSNIVTEELSRKGYTHDGFTESAIGNEKITEFIIDFVNPKTLYAKWIPNEYSVKFNSNNGTSGSMEIQTFLYDSEQQLHHNEFIKDGYTFKGWSEVQNGPVVYEDRQKVINIAESGTVNLYAVWEANNYTVKFDANGGKGTMPDQKFTYDIEQAISTNKFTKDGYTFKGWSTSADGNVEYSDEQEVKNLVTEGSKTLYAVWEANTYEVLFDANGGKGTMPAQSFTYDVDQQLTANAFTRDGYTFLGWARSSTGEVEFANEAEVSNLAKEGEFTIYAVWEANIYNVNFDANGGEGTMTPQSIAFDKHVDLKANAFTRDGYTFEGWSKSADGEVLYQDEENVKNITTEDSITLYAVWTKTYLIEAHDFKIGTEQLKEAGNKAAISELFEEYAGAKTWLKDFEDEALELFVKHDVTINTIPGTYDVEFRSVEDSSVRTTVTVEVVEGIVIVDPKKEFEITAKSFELTVKEAKELATDNSILFERSGVKAINLSNNEEVKVDVDFSAIKAEHGVYDVVFTINGQDTKVTVKATVDKGTAPVIKVDPKVEVIELGKEIDFANGVTITDDRDDSAELITNMVVKGKENVNVNKVDTYIVEYSVIDSDDNVSNTVKRTYIINDGSIGDLEDFYILADNFVIKAEDVDTVNPEAQIVSKSIAEVINKNTGEVEEAIVKDDGGYTNKEGIYDIVLAGKDHDTVTYEIKATVKEEGQVIEGDKYYISAQDFTIGLIDAENISDETIIELSKAEAIHKTLDNGTVEVEHSDIKDEAGTYDVILNVKEEKDTKVTIKVTVLPYDQGNSHKEFMIGANNFKVGKEQLSKAGAKADIDKLFIELAEAKGWNIADKNTALELVVDHTIDANSAVGAHDVTFSIVDEPKATITVTAEILEGSITVDPDKKYELTAHKVELFVGEAKPVVDNNDLLIGLTDAKAIELASGNEKDVVLVDTNIEAKDGEYTAEFQIEGTTVNLVVDVIVKKGGIPVIELAEHVTIVELGTVIDFANGVTINDDRDSHDDLIGNLVVAGKEDVDVDKVGAYTVEYSVMDTDDNTSKKVKRTYIINDGSLPEVVEDHYVLAENFVIESKHVDEVNKDAQILKESNAQIVDKLTGKITNAIVVADGGYNAVAGEYNVTIGSEAHVDIKRDIIATVKDKGGVIEGDKYYISAQDFTLGYNDVMNLTDEKIIELSNAVATHKTLENGTIEVVSEDIQALEGTYEVVLGIVEEPETQITVIATVLPYDEVITVDEFVIVANDFKVGKEQLEKAGEKDAIDTLFIQLANAKGWILGDENTELDLVVDYNFDAQSEVGTYEVTFTLADESSVAVTVSVELYDGFVVVDPDKKYELTAKSVDMFVSKAKEVVNDKTQLIELAEAKATEINGGDVEVILKETTIEAKHGDYIATFEAVDTGLTVTVNIHVDKGDAPIIELDEHVKVINLGDTIDFYDGVSYIEDRDSDDYLNEHLVINGKEDVNTDKVGTYVVNYSVTDSDDNDSNVISRTYIINDGSLPEVVEDHYVLAENFVIKAEDVTEDAINEQILEKSKAQVVNKTTGEITEASVKDNGGYEAVKGQYTILIGSDAHADIEREIIATVTLRDEVIEGDKYYISAQDFTLGYNDVMNLTDEKIIELSNAVATHKTLENGTIEVVSEDIQALEGTYEVVLGIVEEPETQITVIATVLPEDNVIENDEYIIVANDVVYGHKEVLSVTKEQLIADADAKAIHRVTGEEVALDTDYEIDTEIGIYEVTYFLEGQDMEVKASMTVVREALYYIEAQEGTMNLSEYNAAVKAGTLDDKVLEITKAKAHMTTEDNEVINLATFVQDIAERKDEKGNAVSLQVKLGAKEYVNPFLRMLSGERDITAVSKIIEVKIVNDIVESDTSSETPGSNTPETGITQTYFAYIIIAMMSLLIILLNKANRYRKDKI